MSVSVLLLAATLVAGPANDGPWKKAWTNIAPLNHVSQSFVPTSEIIERIDVDLLTGNPKTGESDKLTMTIMDRYGEIIGRASITLQSGFDGWARFTFDPPISTRPGTLVDMQLHDTGKVIFGWRYGLDTYGDGCMYAAKGPDDRFDFRFRVNPQ